MTSSVVMAFFVYKRLIKNPEFGNNPVQVLPKIWRLEQVKNTKSGRNVLYWKATKCLKIQR